MLGILPERVSSEAGFTKLPKSNESVWTWTSGIKLMIVLYKSPFGCTGPDGKDVPVTSSVLETRKPKMSESDHP